jgi:hypothetical protein
LDGRDNKLSGKETVERGSKQFEEPTGPRKKERCEGGNELTGIPREWFNKREGKRNMGGGNSTVFTSR